MGQSNIDRAKRVDFWARQGIRIGGISVIFTVALMLFLILEVALPLFFPASDTLVNTLDLKDRAGAPLLAIGLDDYQEVAYTIDGAGTAVGYRVADGSELGRVGLRAELPKDVTLLR